MSEIPALPSNEQIAADELAADWAFAVRAFHAGEPEYMESMMRGAAPLPPDVRSLAADVIAGAVKVNRRGKGKKSALGLRDREQIAENLAGIRALVREGVDSARMAADFNAAHGTDLIDAGDVRRDMDRRIAGVITFMADKYSVTEAVIKKAGGVPK